MSWTTFPTLTDGQVLTGAHMQLVRDNFAETAPAKATTAGRIFVATGVNSIAERAVLGAYVATAESTASGTFVDLATVGPQVTLTTGTSALVAISAAMENTTINAFSNMGYAVTGASAVAATIDKAAYLRAAVVNQAVRTSAVTLETGLTAGSNIFTAKYEQSSGGGSATFTYRRIAVMGF